MAWLAGLTWLSWCLVWWLLPVVAAVLVSVPVSVYSSRVSLGRALRRCRLFMTPEETKSPEILQQLQSALERRHESQSRPWGTRRIAMAAAHPRDIDADGVGAVSG
jgi:membrane glycosyltransferase